MKRLFITVVFIGLLTAPVFAGDIDSTGAPTPLDPTTTIAQILLSFLIP